MKRPCDQSFPKVGDRQPTASKAAGGSRCDALGGHVTPPSHHAFVSQRSAEVRRVHTGDSSIVLLRFPAEAGLTSRFFDSL